MVGRKEPPRPVLIFVSYAREDLPWCALLRDHLGGLLGSGRAVLFSDPDIDAGQAWEDRIRAELGQAEVVVLILSPRFLASDFIREVELPLAVEREAAGLATIVPVVAEHCDLPSLPVWRLQALPLDKGRNLRPLADWKRRGRENEALAAVAEALRKLVEDKQRRRPGPDPDRDRPEKPDGPWPRRAGALIAAIALLAALGWIVLPRIVSPLQARDDSRTVSLGESLEIDPLDNDLPAGAAGVRLESVGLAPGSLGRAIRFGNRIKYDAVETEAAPPPSPGDVARIEYGIADRWGRRARAVVTVRIEAP